jgi:hypothetical protein
VGCQVKNNVAVIALPNCGKMYSQNFKLLNQFKIPRMFIYLAIKNYKELWTVEDMARSEGLKILKIEATIKT